MIVHNRNVEIILIDVNLIDYVQWLQSLAYRVEELTGHKNKKLRYNSTLKSRRYKDYF